MVDYLPKHGQVIRHHDGSIESAQKITSQSKRGAIWAVEWTWRKHRICLTAAEAERVRGVWKRWKERSGLDLRGHRVFRNGAASETCNVVKYDPHTRKVLDVR